MDTGKSFQYTSASFSLGLGTLAPSAAPQNSSSISTLQLLASTPLGKSLLSTLLPSKAIDQGVDRVPASTQRQQEAPGPGPSSGNNKPAAAPTAAVGKGAKGGDDDGTAIAASEVDDGGQGAANGATAGSSASDEGFIPLPKVAAPAAKKAPAPGSADARADEEGVNSLGRRPHWMSWVKHIESPLLRLHQELVELCELLQPTAEEAAERHAAVAAVTETVTSLWPSAQCQVFGSFATGLYVPTSDIDLVVIDSGCKDIQGGLKALAAALSRKQIARSIQVIGKAKVPIVKFETVDHGNLAFDVSFDVANGPQAAELVKEMTASWPMMRPLILVLKLFLQQRELNEVYTGGVGSYALITMVAAFLQLHGSRMPPNGAGGTGKKARAPQPPLPGTAGDAAAAARSGTIEPSLGTLLVDFLRFYGRVLNFPDVGVSCAQGGQFFRKADKSTPMRGYDGWTSAERPFSLSVEDPKDPDNDVTRNSFNIMRIKMAFEFAYSMLTAPARRDESLLARILRLGPILASRPRRLLGDLRETGYYCSEPERAARRDDREQQRMRDRQQRRAEQQRLAALELEQQAQPSSRDGPSSGSKRREWELAAAADGEAEADGERAPKRKRGSKRERDAVLLDDGEASPEEQQRHGGHGRGQDGSRDDGHDDGARRGSGRHAGSNKDNKGGGDTGRATPKRGRSSKDASPVAPREDEDAGGGRQGKRQRDSSRGGSGGARGRHDDIEDRQAQVRQAEQARAASRGHSHHSHHRDGSSDRHHSRAPYNTVAQYGRDPGRLQQQPQQQQANYYGGHSGAAHQQYGNGGGGAGRQQYDQRAQQHYQQYDPQHGGQGHHRYHSAPPRATHHGNQHHQAQQQYQGRGGGGNGYGGQQSSNHAQRSHIFFD